MAVVASVRRLSWAWLLVALVCAASPGQAEDPLEDYDPTSSWDQVVQPASEARPARQPEQDFKHQLEEWEAVRQAWSEAREDYVQEKRRQREARRTWQQSRSAANRRGSTAAHAEWGEDAFGTEMAPAQPPEASPAIDRLIDSELEESGAAPQAVAAPQDQVAPPRPAPAGSPASPSPVPEPFRQEGGRGGQAPAATDGAAAAKPVTVPEATGSATAAEAVPADDTGNEEAAAGAAAAEAFLKELQEQKKKEQEALRRKARLKVDEEGQVVDPELKKEMEQEPGPEQ